MSAELPLIPVFRPSYGREEADAVAEVLASGWAGLGPRTQAFEEAFAAYSHVPHAAALNSATAALHLAMAALNLGPGDEVIVPAITFISTALAATYCGATPVFAEVDPETLCLDPADAAAKVTSRTKAVVPVHFGGHPADMAAILDLAAAHGLAVVEDCAHAAGAQWQGSAVGSLGAFGCFSFHAVKNLATGDGGMVTTADPAMDARIRRLRWLGISKDTYHRADQSQYAWYYEVSEAGWKYHMNDITAAIGLVQLGKLDVLNAKRRAVRDRYNEAFADLPGVRVPATRAGVVHAAHNYVLQAPDRDGLIADLADARISAGVHYMPLHLHPVYRSLPARVPKAEALWTRLVTLPCYPDMTDEDVRRVIDAVTASVRRRAAAGAAR